ncbi:MAG: hypothetical protein M5U09_18850 [Gammaproteobacteria bacterium]|nr:hypothetical protein [Gammaproteobacteria bacterium]
MPLAVEDPVLDAVVLVAVLAGAVGILPAVAQHAVFLAELDVRLVEL